MARIKDLDTKVRFVLEHYEDTRNSDIRLTQVIWYVYYKNSIKFLNGEAVVALKDMYDLPREDNIKRIRAKIQNEEHLFVPTVWEVAKRRGMKEDDWRSYLGLGIAGIDNQHL